jgi:hypothetical protein
MTAALLSTRVPMVVLGALSGGALTWLVLGALALSVLAVVLDRVNFPQRPFRPKGIDTSGGPVARDRTGAHIVDESDDDRAGPGA